MNKLALLTVFAVGAAVTPALNAAPAQNGQGGGFFSSFVDKKTKKRAAKNLRKSKKRMARLARQETRAGSKTFRKATKRGSKNLRRSIKRWARRL